MIDFNIEKIVPLCEEFGVSLTEEKIAKLNLYGNLLLEWNEKINLTAITEPEEVLYKHFYDCLLFLMNKIIVEYLFKAIFKCSTYPNLHYFT